MPAILALVFVVVFSASAAAQRVVVGDIFRFNAGPCSLTSVDGTPDKIVISQCPVLTTSASTNLTIAPTGDLVLGPGGRDILPDVGYTQNLGALSNKYLTLHAAELWVETLVAQNTIATIGGRVLVAPTNVLTADLTTGATTISVKYNNLAAGHTVYLEADGKVEWLAITSNAFGIGPYIYTVTRNLDGSGANAWFAGDAVLNTGTTGNGFIDLYSLAGVLSGAGPTIVGNVRTGTTFSQIAPRWAIGNLNGLYGYGATTFGTAFGDPAATNVTIDATNGLRIRNGTTDKLVADTAGNLTLTGDLAIGSAGVIRSTSATSLTTGDGFWMSSGATPQFRIGNPAGNRLLYDAGTGVLSFYGNASGATDLNVAAGRNMLKNADCAASTVDWETFTTSAQIFAISSSVPSFRLNDESNTCYFNTAGTPVAATQTEAYTTTVYPAMAGSRYEASAYLAVYRTGPAQVGLLWLNSAGAQISADFGNTCTTAALGGIYLRDFCRSGVVATAPTGTVNVRILILTTHDGTISPTVFWVHAYLGEAYANQTGLTPWGPPGLTEIGPGFIRTGAIQTNDLAAGAITTGKLAAGAVTADKASIAYLSSLSADLGNATAGSFVVGSSNKIWINDSGDGVLAVGGSTKASAPFHVSATGATSMSNLTITGGSINLGSGAFTVASNGDTQVNTLNVQSTLNVNGGVSFNTASWVLQGVSLGVGHYYTMCINWVGQLVLTSGTCAP